MLEPDEILEEINKFYEVPKWVKTKEDALTYAAHNRMRMYQAQYEFGVFSDMIKEKHPGFWEACMHDLAIETQQYSNLCEKHRVPDKKRVVGLNIQTIEEL